MSIDDQQHQEAELITGYSRVAHPLLTELFTDDALNSFVWAWWRCGKRSSTIKRKQMEEWMNKQDDTPLSALCRLAYYLGTIGREFSHLLDLARDPAPKKVSTPRPAKKSRS
jgi:hypothetical protein